MNKIIVNALKCAIVIGFVFAVMYVRNHISVAEVASGSMETTLMTGDTVVIYDNAYKRDEPERGDIVTFKTPESDEIIIKRIVGLPNEKIEIIDNKTYINGVYLEEDYISSVDFDDTDMSFDIPYNKYFVMGDFRAESYDSRFWDIPYIDRSDILGKAIIRRGTYFEFIKQPQ